MIESNLLFIYGTLLPAFDNSWSCWLKSNSEALTEGYMPGILYKVRDYPGATYIPDSGSKVAGLVLKLSDPCIVLKKLDEYEEADGMYGAFDEFKREVVEIYGLDGLIRRCYVYLYNRDVSGLEIIRSGDYVTYYYSRI